MVYAGWKDARLSPLGERQAAALGVYFSTTSPTSFSHIYSSDLQRAHQTASAVQQATKGPPVITNTDLRERHWGIAEGKPYAGKVRKESEKLEDLIAKGVYPILMGRDEKFPEGESFEDLHVRAVKAIREYLVKHLADEVDANIAIASHGLCIGELVSALVKMDPEADQSRNFTGLRNTGAYGPTVYLRGILRTTLSLAQGSCLHQGANAVMWNALAVLLIIDDISLPMGSPRTLKISLHCTLK